MKRVAWSLLAAILSLTSVSAGASGPGPGPVVVGERGAIEAHVDQADIDSGALNLHALRSLGQALFAARFNHFDGEGRPATTGDGAPRTPDQPAFVRTSGPDAISCAGCHAQPSIGGAGDMVANVFVLSETLDPVTFSVDPSQSNERNTIGLFGSGAIEMLAREMSADLIAIREAARADAIASGVPATRPLLAKGISFGQITVMPDGRVDPSGIEGVDWDLIVKPFHQKGAVVSLREFANGAMNRHHGMQSVERFGEGVDADGDGVVDELTVGDITALTIFLAALPPPEQDMSLYPARRLAARRGMQTFADVGCTGCHVPALELDSRMFSEPNPYNPPGNLAPADVAHPFAFDLTLVGRSRSVERRRHGGAIVRAYTDLKRHDLNDADFDHFANEQLAQGTLAGFASPADFTLPPAPRPTREFLTRKLWDAGNSDPYGHRGDLTTLTEAIYWHGGEARAVRDAFFALSQSDRDDVIEFLKTLRMPEARPGAH